ncbi:MAG TPA: DUF4124 domain-containing protein [Steroidobacteraceae bacterium]|nr:DUF4124 domain-containing protein [Steroidobacteraceae bacterium]
MSTMLTHNLPARPVLGALALLAMLGLSGAPRPAAAAADDATRVYRWVDAQGIVHYGDSVPPQYADDAHDVLNDQGVQIGHVAGRESAAQLSAQEQAAQAAAQRAQHDKFLLTTYASAQEIEQLRDERLDQINGQIKASSSYIDSLTLRLDALEERAQHFAPYSADPGAQRMPDELVEDLVRTMRETRQQRSELEAKQQEQITLRVQFAADLERYRELTSRPSS